MQNDTGHFGVITVTAFPGHRFLQTRRLDFTSRASAYSYCDHLQDQLDADCDPARAYVVDEIGMAIRVGRAAFLPANYFFAKHEVNHGKTHPRASKFRPPQRTAHVARPAMGA